MPDPGWDIPGVDRDAASSAGGLLTETSPAPSASTNSADGSGSGTRPARRRKTGRHGSVSAACGFSAGAFAPADHSDAPPVPPAAGSSAAAASPAADCPGDSAAGASAQPGPSSPACGSSAAAFFAGAEDSASGSSASGYPAGSAGASAQPGPSGPGTPGSSAAAGVRPQDAAEALALVSAGLEFLAGDDPAGWSEGLQADCLRALAVAESRQTAAHARVLSAFSVPGGGLAGDGHRSARVWLCWQTRATKPAAAARVAWMRRLAAHPAIAAALAAGTISLSWARQLAAWSDQLPSHARGGADTRLLAAAALGADLPDLAGLAADLRAEHAEPDSDDGDDGFEDRDVRLDTTFEGAGRLTGDLTPGCAHLMQAVLDSLARPKGPEDDRTAGQRRHDALEDAFRRLAAAGTLPQRAGQPARLELAITLTDLLAGDADGNTCDAVIHPLITGHVDYNLLHHLTHPAAGQLPFDTDGNGNSDSTGGGGASGGGGDSTGDDSTGCNDAGGDRDTGDGDTGAAAADGDLTGGGDAGGSDTGAGAPGPDYGLPGRLAGPGAASAGRQDVVAGAIRLLSGPAGVAAALRRAVPGIPLTSVSLPLYMASGFDTVPAHLRRAVRSRDAHCRFPGCDVPAPACDVHHIRWRSRGGRHLLTNLVLLCHYHHHVVIHRQGWTFTLHADGSTTAISPDQTKTLHDHPPPQYAA
jgi:hypothetical protein